MKEDQFKSTCMGCGKVFRSTSQFDEHRISGGKRRCLTTEEMKEKGWAMINNLWRSPKAQAMALRMPFAR